MLKAATIPLSGRPTSGSATVAGYDIVARPAEVRRHIGYVPQLLSADSSLPGYENMLLSARLYSVPSKERSEHIARALARMGLSGAAHHLVGHYSGGMIRRLEIAQSLLHRAPRAVRRARWDVGHWASHLACRCGSVTKVSMTARSFRTSR